MAYLRWGCPLAVETGEIVTSIPPVPAWNRMASGLFAGRNSYLKHCEKREAWDRGHGRESSRYYIFWLATTRHRRAEQELAVRWRPVPEYTGKVDDEGCVEQRVVERTVRKFINDAESRTALIGHEWETEAHRNAVIRAMERWVANLDDHYHGLYRPKGPKRRSKRRGKTFAA